MCYSMLEAVENQNLIRVEPFSYFNTYKRAKTLAIISFYQITWKALDLDHMSKKWGNPVLEKILFMAKKIMH